MRSIAVIGLGQFGFQLAIGLSQKGFEVIALDRSDSLIADIKDMVAQAIVVDALDERALRKLNINNIDTAVVAIGTNVQSSLLIAALLQKLGINDIYVRAIEPLQERILHSMGIRNILNIEKEMGIQLSNTISSDKVGRYIAISSAHSLIEICVPKSYVGKTLRALDLRYHFKINIVGIKHRVLEIGGDGEANYGIRMSDVPDPDYPLKKDDLLVIVGTDENLQRFLRSGGDD